MTRRCKNEDCRKKIEPKFGMQSCCDTTCHFAWQAQKGAKPKKRKQLKTKPKTPLTPYEKQLHADMRAFGCCISYFVFGKQGVACDIHHIMDGSRRMGEAFVLPLAPLFHRQGTAEYPSIHSVNSKHGGRVEFHKAYGYTELDLLEMMETILDKPHAVRESKIVPRAVHQ